MGSVSCTHCAFGARAPARRDINSPFMLCVINKSEIYIDRPMELTTTIQIVFCCGSHCAHRFANRNSIKMFIRSRKDDACEKTKVSVTCYTNWIAFSISSCTFCIFSTSSEKGDREDPWMLCTHHKKNKTKQTNENQNRNFSRFWRMRDVQDKLFENVTRWDYELCVSELKTQFCYAHSRSFFSLLLLLRMFVY